MTDVNNPRWLASMPTTIITKSIDLTPALEDAARKGPEAYAWILEVFLGIKGPAEWAEHNGRRLFFEKVARDHKEFVHGTARGSFPSECPRCNYDRHNCPGCGEWLYHGTEVCGPCRKEHFE
jgi:hypothetical protein